MARQSNKTESQRISELQAQIARLQGKQAEKEYSSIACVQTLNQNLTSIREQLANTAPLLAETGIRSFAIRIKGAQLKATRYQAEQAYNALLEKHGQNMENALSAIMSEAIQRLQKGEGEDKVQSFIQSAQKRYAKENAEATKAISEAMDTANQAIQACEEHSNLYTPRTNSNAVKAREFFRRYSSPFNL